MTLASEPKLWMIWKIMKRKQEEEKEEETEEEEEEETEEDGVTLPLWARVFAQRLDYHGYVACAILS